MSEHIKPPTSEFLTVREFCEWFRVPPATAQRWLTEGYIPHVKIGGHVRISRAAMDAIRIIVLENFTGLPTGKPRLAKRPARSSGRSKPTRPRRWPFKLKK